MDEQEKKELDFVNLKRQILGAIINEIDASVTEARLNQYYKDYGHGGGGLYGKGSFGKSDRPRVSEDLEPKANEVDRFAELVRMVESLITRVARLEAKLDAKNE